MPKKITIEHLATMIARGFEETTKKPDMDRRFNKVDERLDKVEGRLGNVENRLGKIESILSLDYKRRIEKLELEMKELKNALAL
ncbi:MAG: hypothetical protein AAB861_00295 [Patescibacteria group bacterium]